MLGSYKFNGVVRIFGVATLWIYSPLELEFKLWTYMEPHSALKRLVNLYGAGPYFLSFTGYCGKL